MPHPIVHVELSSHNSVAAAEFYRDIFGWSVMQMPEMSYATFETGEGVGGGFSPISPENPAGTVMVYILTDDIEATLEQIQRAGGKVLRTKTEIPGMGWFAIFRDLSGNQVGLFTAMSPGG